MKPNIHEQLSTDPPERDELDPEAVRNTIRARGEEIKRRELQRTVNRLESNGDLTTEQLEIIRQMATAIVDGILAAPEEALEDSRTCDSETYQKAIELFDPDR
ncbi:glutamyl-tRNA reductase (plasmid) [Halobacterium sp. MBLA0001]|uniref:glutamyl-tRNA reductase n=1 Tax=Halobacterium sp. MBLA0001 TaxID=3413511 RepID=UPI003C76856F